MSDSDGASAARDLGRPGGAAYVAALAELEALRPAEPDDDSLRTDDSLRDLTSLDAVQELN